MLTLVIGTDPRNIDRAVEILVDLEKDKKVVNFKDIMENLKNLDKLPDINDSVILLDYSEIPARKSSTKEARLMTYMIMQSRKRNNIWIAKARDWKKIKGAPNIDRRIYRSHDILVTAGEGKMVLWNRIINKKKVITYGHK